MEVQDSRPQVRWITRLPAHGDFSLERFYHRTGNIYRTDPGDDAPASLALERRRLHRASAPAAAIQVARPRRRLITAGCCPAFTGLRRRASELEKHGARSLARAGRVQPPWHRGRGKSEPVLASWMPAFGFDRIMTHGPACMRKQQQRLRATLVALAPYRPAYHAPPCSFSLSGPFRDHLLTCVDYCAS